MTSMDVYKIKEYLMDNLDQIPLLLYRAGFADIEEYNNNEFRCAWDDGLNPMAVRVKIDDLTAQAFSMNVKGDIITLIQEKMKLSFYRTLDFICEVCLIDKKQMEQDYIVELPFGGYYKNIAKIRNNTYDDLPIIPELDLKVYGVVPNMRFYKDNISIETMERYKIGYDTCTDRISVCWRNEKGDCVGIMGRLNREHKDSESKWFPIIPFPKNQTLYGLYENKKSIKEVSTLFIFESEKGTMQLSSMGLNLGISLGGNSLSKWQINTIKSLFTDRVIVCLDEGLEEEHSKQLAEQLKMDGFFKNKSGYIFDLENKYLKKGSKNSPTDLGKDVFKSLVKECVVWV